MVRRVALLGCGRIATKRHAPLLGSGEIPGATLAAVCDIDGEKARAMGEKYGIPWYTDGDAMMERENPDILSILTPSGKHYEHAMRCINSYRVPVVVEKPLSLVRSDAEALTLAARFAKVPLFTVLQNRFNPPVEHLARAVRLKRFGTVVSASVCVRWSRKEEYYRDWHGTWAQAGGVLANQAIHHIDLLVWLLGMPKLVYAHATHTRSREVEDTLVGTAVYDDGKLVTIEVTAAAGKDTEGSIAIVGTKGTAKVGGFAVNKMEQWQFEEELPDDGDYEAFSENPPDVYGYGHRSFYEHVLRCLDNGIPSFIDGRPSLELVTALYQSVELGIPVEIGNYGGVSSSRLGKGV